MKVRFNLRQEFVVGGYKPAGKTFDSLLAGYYEGRRLLYAGKVRAGLTPQTRLMLFERLQALAATRCPFRTCQTRRPATGAKASPRMTWTRCAG